MTGNTPRSDAAQPGDIQSRDIQSRDPRCRAPGYVIIGLSAIAVAAWVLAGSPAIDDAATVGKIAVGACLLLGITLIATGARKSTPRR